MAKGEETRVRILETAVKMASKEGLRGLTIGTLAKAVGMSKSGLFAHFHSKDKLQVMVFQLAATDFTDRVLKPSFNEPKGEPRVRALFENWIKYLNDNSGLPGGKILFSATVEISEQKGALRNAVKAGQKLLIETIQKSAQLAVEQAHFRKDMELELFAWSLYAFILGYDHSARVLQDPLAEQFARRSFEGLIQYSKSKDVDYPIFKSSYLREVKHD